MKLALWATCLLAGVSALAVPAKADLVFDFLPANTFTGTAPTGSLTADFHTVATGVVTLTLTSSLAAGEFVLPGDGFYFNVIQAFDATTLTFTPGTLPASVTATSVATGSNAYKPDGDGLMDIEITFSPSSAKALVGGESLAFTITGAGVTENTFDDLSNCVTGCGTGAHYAAVHVGGTPGGGGSSAWVGGTPSDPPVTTPEPLSIALLGTALAGLGLVRRQRK